MVPYVFTAEHAKVAHYKVHVLGGYFIAWMLILFYAKSWLLIDMNLTLLGLGLIKINDVSANFNNPRPSLLLNN